MSKKKTIEITNGLLKIENVDHTGLFLNQLEVHYNSGFPIIVIHEGKNTITYSLNKVDFECLKEFIK
jgi:hypothetical protein